LEYLDDVLINGDDIIVCGETDSNDFPMIEGSNDRLRKTGTLVKFSEAGTTPADPDPNNPDNPDDSGGGGGGGGCFVSTLF
jgi:hypothetical protein